MRIISQPRYPSPIPVVEAVERLSVATSAPYHEHWPCSVNLLDGRRVLAGRIHGPKQITDNYLLALAVEQGGRLVTFDGTIPRSAVQGAEAEHLVVL